MKRVKKKRLIVFFVAICLLISAGYYLYKYSQNVNKEINIKYEEKSNVDYKVYLKENSFFETPYLEKNRTYIASLIDYILIDYNYTFKIDEKLKGSYSYYIKGTVSANKNNSTEAYWSKDYLLTEKVTKNYENTDEITISSETKINYQVYNNLLNDFKSQYGVTMDGLLNVSLVIENTIETDLIDRKILKSNDIDLNIPLTTLTIEVPIETNEQNNNGILISETVQQNVLYYTTMKYIGYVCFAAAGVLLVIILYALLWASKYENKYNKTLKRILKTYDNIIVNVQVLPSTDELNVIKVTSFDELIDAHGEIRQPINYYSHEKGATFILINDSMAWRYDLVKEPPKNREKI